MLDLILAGFILPERKQQDRRAIALNLHYPPANPSPENTRPMKIHMCQVRMRCNRVAPGRLPGVLRQLAFLGLLPSLVFLPACARPENKAMAEEASIMKAAKDGTTVFVEAEGFANKGGWVVDQQYMDQMGSPVMLAHGMGAPVANATTEVTFSKTGEYRVFVRTRNWIGRWTPEYAPGVFKLIVDGKPLGATFGNKGAAWEWQDGGTVTIARRKTALSLRDLTGFEGRCDAILFSSDPNFVPPEGDLLAAFRSAALGLTADPKDAPDAPGGPFDLVVSGGGMAGICAAISAARLGVKVALIQNRPVLGGNNSSEVRVHLRGRINYPPYENIGNLVGELDSLQTGIARPGGEYGDDKKLAAVLAEKNITLHLSTHVMAVEMDNAAPEGYTRPAIKAVIAKNIETNKELRFEAKWFADCTGDGSLGFMAGAECRQGRESRAQTGENLAPEKPDNQSMGASMPWNTADALDAAGRPVATAFPALPWAMQFDGKTAQPSLSTSWNWESGMYKDQILDSEEVRDHLFRCVYGHWAYMKNQSSPEWREKAATKKLNWVSFIAGKRESRRIMGDVVLHEQDILMQKKYNDSCVTGTWDIDLHYATDLHQKYFPGEEFRTIADRKVIEPYQIPYRCFYSKDVPNLFMAGRNISVTHVALGTMRVMRTVGMMGEVVGMAASVCKKYDATPRGVYKEHLADLIALMKKGVAPKPAVYQKTAKPVVRVAMRDQPEWLKSAGINLALNTEVSVSSSYSKTRYQARNINNGTFDYSDNDTRWASAKSKEPHHVILRFAQPTAVNAARVVSGQAPGVDPITDFVLQYKEPSDSGKPGEWLDIPEIAVRDNKRLDVGLRFPVVRASEYRLLITATPDGIARIWDLQLYELKN